MWTWGAGTGHWLRRLCPWASSEKRWSHAGKRTQTRKESGRGEPRSEGAALEMGQWTISVAPFAQQCLPAHTRKSLGQFCSRKRSPAKRLRQSRGKTGFDIAQWCVQRGLLALP